MKTFTLFLFFSCSYFISNAQLSYGVINDKDGFVNVRKEKNAHSPIVGKIFNESIFGYAIDDKSNWAKIYKQDEKKPVYLEGYIDRNRIKPFTAFKKLNRPKVYHDSCTIKNDTLSIIIKASIFISRQHKLSYEKPGCKNCVTVLTKIDNKRIWGTDGELPRKIYLIFNINAK